MPYQTILKKKMSKIEKKKKKLFFGKNEEKKNLVEIFCFGHLRRKTTYGRRPDKSFHFPDACVTSI